MRFAIDVPNFGLYSDPHFLVQLARETEAAGWDGLSLWDHILVYSGSTVADPWVLLSAAAGATERITLMTMVTPLPRRRPWVVARQAVSLDQLSNGRFILGVGIGYPPGPEFEHFDEPGDERTRADMLDEGLQILAGMWSGEPFSFAGRHYRIDEAVYGPTPVQRPRIPIWVAGMWPFKRPFLRAAQWDGVAPIGWADGNPGPLSPEDLAESMAYVRQHRTTDEPFDVAVGFGLTADASAVAEYADAGATWMRMIPGEDTTGEELLQAIRSGPPRG